MKKLLLLCSVLLIFISVRSQTINCTNFCVLGMSLDTANHELNVTIYDGDTNSVNYPTVVVVNNTGDTVGNINNQFYLFAQLAGDTITHTIPTTLTNLPSGFTGTVYLTDAIWDITCSFPYPMSCSVGVSEGESENSISVFPDPAQDYFTISLGKQNNKNAVINISDLSGKIIRNYSTSQNYFTVKTSELQSGMYFISVLINDKRFVKSVVVK
jgi:hypothetical protein